MAAVSVERSNARMTVHLFKKIGTVAHGSGLVSSKDHHKPHNIKPRFNNYSI